MGDASYTAHSVPLYVAFLSGGNRRYLTIRYRIDGFVPTPRAFVQRATAFNGYNITFELNPSWTKCPRAPLNAGITPPLVAIDFPRPERRKLDQTSTRPLFVFLVTGRLHASHHVYLFLRRQRHRLKPIPTIAPRGYPKCGIHILWPPTGRSPQTDRARGDF